MIFVMLTVLQKYEKNGNSSPRKIAKKMVAGIAVSFVKICMGPAGR